MTTKKRNILTVGDGDLTLSLALARAYDSSYIKVTASVLESKEELLISFPDAPLIELDQLGVSVWFGVDATQLHEQHYPPDNWDVVLFHHPHLGLALLGQDEAEHAIQHYQLLCHYLYSASRVSRLVHLCLCGNQRVTWDLDQAANRQGLQLRRQMTTAVPISKVWTDEEVKTVEACPEHAAPRRYRNGKLGSRHFLGKHGYRHRRTAGEQYHGSAVDMNVTGSMHFVFTRKSSDSEKMNLSKSGTVRTNNNDSGDSKDKLSCSICGALFVSKVELESHITTPATPQAAEFSNTLDPSSTTAVARQPSPTARARENKTTIPDDWDNTKSPHHCDHFKELGKKEYELVVDPEHNGKRFRRFLNHHTTLSKRKAELAITSGRAHIDDIKTVDSGHILKTGMNITVYGTEGGNGSVSVALKKKNNVNSAPTICFRKGPMLVAEKPSGMRNKGAFSGTLEFQVSQQCRMIYESLSALDTSCSGMCVLMTQDSRKNRPPPRIQHSLLALVHGRIPDEWYPYRERTVQIHRKWKPKKKRKHSDDGEGETSPSSLESTKIFILPVERTTESEDGASASHSSLRLSTIRIQTEYPSAASVCYWMRHEGYPIVGDTNCRQEYLELKRSIRNRIKTKLCLTCVRVEWMDEANVNETIKVPTSKLPIPDKLSANYWESNFAGPDASKPPVNSTS